MHIDTVRYLNALNAQFYATTAHEFDQTRGQAWAGWLPLIPYIRRLSARPVRVLDVGCGNGRWGVFLAENGMKIHYHGVDNNPQLLAAAHSALQETRVPFTLTEADALLDDNALNGQYEVVVAFGVVHHVPSLVRRTAFIQQLAQRVTEGGLLAFATWRFYENARLRERVAGWDSLPDLPFAETLEEGDYLLDWRRGARALRYCHYTNDEEHDALSKATGLNELAHYRADGQDNILNAYSLLERPTP